MRLPRTAAVAGAGSRSLQYATAVADSGSPTMNCNDEHHRRGGAESVAGGPLPQRLCERHAKPRCACPAMHEFSAQVCAR